VDSIYFKDISEILAPSTLLGPVTIITVGLSGFLRNSVEPNP